MQAFLQRADSIGARRTTTTRAVALAAILSIAVLSNTPTFADHLSNYAAPTGLSASVVGANVMLTWDAYPSSNFPSDCGTPGREIRIYRSDNGAAFFLRTTASASSTTFTDVDLPEGTYDYQTRARCNVPPPPGPGGADTNNLSLPSNTASVVVSFAPPCAGPPSVDPTASPLVLWPPNGKLVPVTVMGTVTPQAYCTMPASLSYWIVDEYGLLTSANSISVAVAADGTFGFPVSLEASRLGTDLDGRLYTIFVVADGTAEEIEVRVPHDQRKK